MIDDGNDEMESTEKKQPSKKMLFQVTDLTNFCSFLKLQYSKPLQKHTAQHNKFLMLPSCKKQSTIPSFFKICITQ